MRMITLLALAILVSCGDTTLNAPATTGPQGPKGDKGETGASADSITVVPLCPNHGVTVYPSTFAEVALCIANDLYAVYWDGHNSWLTKIPPGAYISTSSTLPCSFVVTSGCQVTD